LKTLIHSFKYGQKTGLRHLFVHIMASFIRDYHLDIAQFDLIAPIPLSSTRLRERGYNQAQLLGEGMAKEFSIPLSDHNLIRQRHTQQQTLLDEKERWTNIKRAFTIKHLKVFEQKNILIIDDLLTTGATASEAARTLKNHGAGKVGVLTLAITI
jgi:ComF family protein